MVNELFRHAPAGFEYSVSTRFVAAMLVSKQFPVRLGSKVYWQEGQSRLICKQLYH